MRAIALALLAAANAPEPPTTVNGEVLGQPEDFATRGPARVCLRDMVVSPREGEIVYLEYLGIHDARLRLVLADGTFVTLTQGDAFLDRRHPGQEPVIVRSTQRYYLIGEADVAKYQMVTADDASREHETVLFVSGSALSGDQSDGQIFARLAFGAEQDLQCDRRFGYGWDGIFWTKPAGGIAE